MSVAITQPLDSAGVDRGIIWNYPVSVPPKPQPQPKANLKLLLPTSLSALKLDLGRLWLTRTLRKSQLRSNLPPPEEHFHAADDQPRVRTPVFTLPPVLNADPPSHASILPIPTPMPMPMPIKLPKLLSLSLTLALPEPETICDWADQPSVTFSPKGNVHSATPATRARGVSAVEREVGDARYVSPLLRSPPPSSRDFVESEGWECEWNLMRLEREDDGWGDDDYDEDEDGEEEFDSEDSLSWPGFAFDEAYLGDTEDSWSDNEDETTSSRDGQRHGADGDCFVWDAEIWHVSRGFEDTCSED